MEELRPSGSRVDLRSEPVFRRSASEGSSNSTQRKEKGGLGGIRIGDARKELIQEATTLGGRNIHENNFVDCSWMLPENPASPGHPPTSALHDRLPSLASAEVQGKDLPMNRVAFRTIEIDGLSVFYREAGVKSGETLLLLHGLPSSSRMFEPLFARLSDRYHLIAPDYPGFGHSDWP